MVEHNKGAENAPLLFSLSDALAELQPRMVNRVTPSSRTTNPVRSIVQSGQSGKPASLGLYAELFSSLKRPFGEQTKMFEDLTRIGREMGVGVVVLAPGCVKGKTVWKYDQQTARWREVRGSVPPVVIRRSGTFSRTNRQVVNEELAALQKAGRLHTLPRVCSNKWHLYQLLKKDAIIRSCLVKTALAKQANEVFTLAKRWGDVYVKPLAGAQGVQIHRIKATKDVMSVLFEERVVPRVTERVSNVFHPETKVYEQTFRDMREFRGFWEGTGLVRCIVQETVALPKTNEEQPFDFRWLVQCTNQPIVIARVARVGKPGAVTTNIHTGGQAVEAEQLLQKLSWPDATKVIEHMDDIAIQVYRTLAKAYGSFAEVGIDLALREDGSVVIFEINPTPGRRMLRSVGVGIRELSLRCLLEYAIRANGA